MDKQLLSYFVKRTDERLDQIEGKIDRLLQFKWQIIGGSAILSVLVTIGIQVFIKN